MEFLDGLLINDLSEDEEHGDVFTGGDMDSDADNHEENDVAENPQSIQNQTTWPPPWMVNPHNGTTSHRNSYPRGRTQRASNESVLKLLLYLLRHGAPSHGIQMNSEGYCPVDHIHKYLTRRLKCVDLEQIYMVANSACSAIHRMTLFQIMDIDEVPHIRATHGRSSLLAISRKNQQAPSLSYAVLEYISNNLSKFESYDIPNFLMPQMTEILVQKLKAKKKFTNKTFREHFITPQVQSMNFSGTFVSDSSLRLMGNVCLEMVKLDFPKQETITDNTLHLAIKCMRKLEYLNLAECTNITSKSLHLSRHSLVNLQVLILSRCSFIDDEGLRVVAATCPKLEYLDLKNLIHVTDKGISEIATKCALLKVFLCDGIKKLSDNALESINRLPQLNTLSLSGCALVTEDGLISMVQNLKNIQSLSVGDGPRVTDRVLDVITNSPCRETLEYLDLEACAVSVPALVQMTSACRLMRILVLSRMKNSHEIEQELSRKSNIHIVTHKAG